MTFRMLRAQSSLNTNDFIQNRVVRRHRTRIYTGFFKRLMDIVIVIIAALPVAAVVAVLAALVALDGKSPFFAQNRVGRNGVTFRMWKLRSMVNDAEAQLETYLNANPEHRREWDEHQKLRHDPRITPIGRIIRKTSLDELPQLFNVLKGDMSIVGPRPMMPSQRAMYPGLAYFAMRPGITGFWQISVRNESSFAERVEFDNSYFKEMSFVTDVSVILRTFRVVLCGTGC
ncbi:Sugar transferase involved in LPS biosynthesis (colanic, teichoic acid) [Roseovarius marisflavi]|uniref:Sugar transferase involved in LPS biosynthesis (Colanic, teichoic acid) n=2 Tax=Roseovarius marisflavi TaxID=1054996 RepID=A0A1M7BM83_9RHOB|nr:sugar transferase [Roseovarius marisflavi]SHL56074.1 Sugar transferase involved in LPS biosynthesis (colanic, teichoic acid) [Roseovarius marisflavi]